MFREDPYRSAAVKLTCAARAYRIYDTYCATNGTKKNGRNQQRYHGISFELAALVFEAPHCLVGLNHVDETGEQRWHDRRGPN